MKYKLEKIALLAEIFGGFAILISLIFVGFQFKENAKATRSATATATNATVASWYSSIGNDQQSSMVLWQFLGDPESLTQQERYQPILNIHGQMLSFQNMYFLAKEETLDNRISESLSKVLMGVKDQPGFMFYWNTRKSLFFVEFQNYVDKILTSD